MRRVFLVFMIVLSVFLIGCSKKEEVPSEPIVTAKVINTEPEIEEKTEVKENITTIRLCHDTDNGVVRWEKGSIFGFYNNATRFEFDDYCQNNNYLVEFYCENEIPLSRIFLCKNGCIDAHCA